MIAITRIVILGGVRAATLEQAKAQFSASREAWRAAVRRVRLLISELRSIRRGT